MSSSCISKRDWMRWLKLKKEDIGYVAEDVALKEKIRLLKWVLEEE